MWFSRAGLSAVCLLQVLGCVDGGGSSVKLCVSYPRTVDKQEVNYKNGYTKINQPQYPFGYGLSYTNYSYSNLQIQPRAKISEDWIKLSFQVKNSGSREGTEIVQLYVSPKDPESSMKPIQLKGFERVELEAGEEKQVSFEFSPEQLVQYKGEQWIIEPGNYEFKIGASCTDIRLNQSVLITGDPRILENGRSIFFTR